MDEKAQKNDQGGVSMAGDLFTIIDITRNDLAGLSPHEQGMIDFVQWLSQPRDRPPFSWLSTFEGFSREFWHEGVDALYALAHHAQRILERKEQEKQSLPVPSSALPTSTKPQP